MAIVNMHAAKTNLSKLVEQALAGEEVIIARAGKPAVKMVPCTTAATKPNRVPGALKGKIWMADDFDELPEEIAAAFRGERD
ncbi:MAG: type II toxin-antitoxin system prevent-host-death family antitoxin [Candidatus Sumerlaeaceae bacterium]|nr:type II toxin-antitoxin system prevent-host-death family antitoxin [Candidatus Sumerlaeaceae bacterium]